MATILTLVVVLLLRFTHEIAMFLLTNGDGGANVVSLHPHAIPSYALHYLYDTTLLLCLVGYVPCFWTVWTKERALFRAWTKSRTTWITRHHSKTGSVISPSIVAIRPSISSSELRVSASLGSLDKQMVAAMINGPDFWTHMHSVLLKRRAQQQQQQQQQETASPATAPPSLTRIETVS
jgi:hypothetical protein